MAFSSVPYLDIGVVVGYGKNNTLMVMLRSGQQLGTPVNCTYDGLADNYCIDQQPLPIVGTWGLIGFVYADDRNAFWIKSLYIQPGTAINKGISGTDNTVKYQSHPSGDFTYLDESGTNAHFYADGSTFLTSTNTTFPEFPINVVQNGQITQVPLANSDRITQNTFNFSFNHASGTDVEIDSTGNTSVTLASGASATITQGSFSIKIDGSGNVTVIGQTVNISTPSGAQTVLDSSGDVSITGQSTVSITASEIELNGNVSISGSLSAGGSSGASASFSGPISSSSSITASSTMSASNFVSSTSGIDFNGHYHGGVTTGGGNTNPPSGG